jgi:phosphate/sulfate permease
LRNARPRFINRFFGKAQIASAAYMGFAHGLADAQKTMGVITLALVTATAAGSFQTLPNWCSFLKMDKTQHAEEAIMILQEKAPDAAKISEAAAILESEAAMLKNGEFREAFFTLAATAYTEAGKESDAVRTMAAAKQTHDDLLAKEAERLMPKIPLIGKMVAAKFTDWKKTLQQEMDAATAAGKPTLATAAKKVDGLSPDVPAWIKIICALTMAAGTAAGGWKIIKTLGHKMVKLHPVHGFAAETTAATLLAVTGSLGMTVSTTHSITTAIMGVGCAKRFNALNLSLIERIIWAWVLTLPAAAIVGYLMVKLFQLFGWLP